MFAELRERLVDLRKRTARFRRVALHLHSPDSHDWGHGGETGPNDRALYTCDGGHEAFCAALRPHLDLVSITDHMRSGFAARVSASTAGGDGFCVLPGMEVNLKAEAALGSLRIHLLVILPAGAPVESFERLFSGLPGIPARDADRNGQETIEGISLADWVKRVHAENGICIAAHVDNNQGVRCRFRQTARETLRLFHEDGAQVNERDIGDSLKEYLFGSGLDAVEIHRSQDAPHYRWVAEVDGTTRWVPTVLTFDAHCVEHFGRRDRVTHVKMTSLGLDGLRDALAFPDTRVRFPTNLPPLPAQRVIGFQIAGGPTSFFEDATVGLAENLNCLIGARGSGKSTVVEALRYVFGYNRTLHELGRLEQSVCDLQKANLGDSEIRVVYQTAAGDERILAATFDPKEDYATRVFTVDGDPVEVADVEACGDFPLRLFGWSEIETLGREPGRQRDLLDRLIPEIAPVLRRRADLRDRLRVSRGTVDARAAAVKAAYQQGGGEIRRFKEFREDFANLNTEEVRTLFAAIDLAKAKQQALVNLKENADALAGRLGGSSDLTLRDGIEELLEQGPQALRDWWRSEELRRLAIVSAEEDVRKSVREGVEKLRSFVAVVGDHLSEAEREAQALELDLRERFAGDNSMQRIADLRRNAEKRLRRVQALRADYEERWQALIEAMTERQWIVEELARTQNEIAGIRSRLGVSVQDRLNRFLPDEMRVSIDFRAGGDTEQFGQWLHGLLGARGNQPKRIRRIVQAVSMPAQFASMIRSGDFSGMVGRGDVGDAAEQFSREDAERCSELTRLFEQDEFADVPVLADGGKRLEKLLDLEEVPWDDREAILLNDRPVNEKSPGQRSSAMLPLIALSESTPLVIDQPEDNLDKRLIGNVLVRVLAELKEQRQIIVCTHDPNILVGGDAEQVVVLEAESDRRGRVVRHGSIDNTEIVETVIDLLEGGAEAFEVRRKRYRGKAGLPA